MNIQHSGSGYIEDGKHIKGINMYLIYNIIIFVIIILYLPVLIYNKIKGGYEEGVKEKFSFISKEKINSIKDKSVIWIQAASVGEVMATKPLIKNLKNKYPEKEIVLSTMTDTGRETAKKIDLVSKVIYFPFDFNWFVKRSLKMINPDLVILIETELWPNFIKEARKMNSKVMVSSGRISDSSIKNYKYLKPLLKKSLAKVDHFSMQTETDKKRIIEMGAPSELVSVEGNIKFDREFDKKSNEVEIRNKFKISKSQPVVVAGSTHADEEEQLISVYNKLKEKYPDLVFLIAPRYIERSKEIQKIYENNNINTRLKTEIDKRKTGEDLIIVNTLGELVDLYKIAELVFIGGSLIKRGGHNILEPAAQKTAVFFGPHMFNFKKDRNYFLNNEAAIQVEDSNELADQMLKLLNNPKNLAKISNKAKKLVDNNRGACDNNIQIASKLLDKKKKRKILLVRLSAIGDVIHALPIANAIREKYNKAEIDWIVEKKAIDLVEMNPYLDNVYKLPKAKWKDDFKENKLAALKEAKDFFKNFKKKRFDEVLDVHGLFKSGITTYFSGANKRYGPADGREGSKLFYTDILDLPEAKIHQVERSMNLARSFGAKTKEIDYGLNVPEKTRKRLKEKAENWNLTLDNLVVINPFTTWESKDWFIERYNLLVNELLEKYDYEIVFTGGPGEKEKIEKILNDIKSRDRVFNLAGKTDLKELTALYEKAELFIGGDTGPLHLAAALELGVVAIMGPTDPKTHGPYNENSIVLQADIKCKNCWNRKCKRDKHYCMEKIEVVDVLNAIEKVKKSEQVINNEK